MSFNLRQRTGVADIACVAMLCAVTTLLLGFSTEQHARGVADSVKSLTPNPLVTFPSVPFTALDNSLDIVPDTILENEAPLGARPTSILAIESLVSLEDGWLDKPAVKPVVYRPFSLADAAHITPVLGGVSARRWQNPSVYSPDRVLTDQHGLRIGTFHGTGFPDIRTYNRAKPSPFDAPGPWAPLIAWRTIKGSDEPLEPIARVRCMGLSPQAVARRADRYRDMITSFADTYAVSQHLVKAVITVESCFNNQALSPVGAQGLMQLMPDTATWLNVNDSHDPAQNLRGGVKYLAALQKEFDTTELALAAYNAGPGNVRRYNGVPPFAETLAYVVKVQSHYRRYKAAHRLQNPVEDVAGDNADDFPDEAANLSGIPVSPVSRLSR